MDPEIAYDLNIFGLLLLHSSSCFALVIAGFSVAYSEFPRSTIGTYIPPFYLGWSIPNAYTLLWVRACRMSAMVMIIVGATLALGAAIYL